MIVPKPRSWSERYRQRHDWALQAYDRFVHELAPEVSGQLRRSEQVTVVVYGATQVGKTTLILDLLGLVSDTREEIAEVLRGGQTLGKSATIMPLRYGRSSDDHWYIGQSGPLDRQAATRALADTRRAVEQGQRTGIDLTDILIPARFFPLASENALDVDVKLIDLPGLDARNAHERELVATLARTFVTVADLVLLVTQASSLGFLRPENLQIEELANWVHQPVRFRVVITSSFSLSSVRKRMLAAPMDVTALRSAMSEEIQTLELTIPEHFQSNLFVMELGDSAREMAEADPAYFALVCPVVDTFRRQLIEDIKRSSGPLSRVFAAFQLDQVVTGQIAAFEDSYREQRRERLASLEAFESRQKALYPLQSDDDVARVLQVRRDELLAERQLTEQWTHMLEGLLRIDIGPILEGLFPTHVIARGEQTVPAVQELLRCAKKCLKHQLESWIEAFQTLLFSSFGEELQGHCKVLMRAVRPVVFDESDFHPLDYHLDQYTLESYFWSSSYETDMGMLEHVVAVSRGRCIKLAHMCFIEAVKNQASEQQRALPEVDRQLRAVQEALDKHARHLRGLQALSDQLSVNIARMEGSKKMAQHFEQRVDQSLSRALQACTDELDKGQCATDKFLGLMQAHLLISEAEKFYSGKDAQ
ncbi:hypothetical protein BG030_03905 [Pseudomonas putida]|nr:MULTISPECIES: dynamin family protein [Pseudomonas]APE97247.1 hypothetical protein BG030_03905 [Pseudomonas putida]